MITFNSSTKLVGILRKIVRCGIIVPIGIIMVVPIVSMTWFISPWELYKEFFEYLRSGKSFGVFD